MGMPPPASGSGARRVHNTTPSGQGSPDATPRGNGNVRKSGCANARVVYEWLRDRREAKLPRDVQELAPRQALQRTVVEANRITHEEHARPLESW